MQRGLEQPLQGLMVDAAISAILVMSSLWTRLEPIHGPLDSSEFLEDFEAALYRLGI